MTASTITIPNIEVQVTVDQLIEAVGHLEPAQRAEVMRALAGNDYGLSEDDTYAGDSLEVQLALLEEGFDLGMGGRLDWSRESLHER